MASSSANAKKLACNLIHTHFGELVGKVCRSLLETGILTLPELTHFTLLNPAQITSSIFVLVQHNCVQPFFQQLSSSSEKTEQPTTITTTTKYAVLLDVILHRLRFPKFLGLVRQDLNQDEAVSLFQGLLEHGRLSFQQIRDRAEAQAHAERQSFDKMSLQKTFSAVVASHFIERCPTTEPVLPAQSDNANYESKEQHVAAAAVAAMAEERFRLPWSENGESCVNKRKFPSFAGAENEEEQIPWRINYEELIRRLRNRACVSQVRSMFDLSTGTVLQGILNQGNEIWFSGNDEMIRAVHGTRAGAALAAERISGATDLLVRAGFLINSGEKFCANPQKIIEAARKREVESIVFKRYGSDGCRVFGLVASKGSIALEQIWNQGVLGENQTKEILFRLAKDEFLEQQEVPNCGFVWRLGQKRLVDRMIDELYGVALDLVQRLQRELEKEQEIADAVKQAQQQQQEGEESQQEVTLTEAQQQQVKRVHRIATMLEASLLKLDASILLFHCF